MAPEAGGPLQVNYTSAIEGTSVVLNPICTTGSPLAGDSWGFSVSGGRLTLMATYGDSVFVSVYSRQ
jgi:hypothetical protein